MDKLISKKNRTLEVIHSIENWVLVLITIAIVFFSGIQIVLRNAFDTGITWVPPMLGILVIWIGLLGALIATRNNAHIKINILTTYLSEKYKPVAFAVSYLFSALILIVLTYYSIEFVKLDLDSNTTAFGDVPVWLAQSILPATFFFMSVRYTAYTVANILEIYKRIFR